MEITEYFVTIVIPKKEPNDTIKKLEKLGMLQNIAIAQKTNEGYRYDIGYKEITGILIASAVILRQIRLLVNELKDKHDDLEFEIKDKTKEIRIKGHKETIETFFERLKKLLTEH